MTTSTPMPCAHGADLARLAQGLGVEIEVSPTPFPPGAYTRPPHRCPCGHLWYYQPTTGQVLEWAIRGTR